MKLLGKAIASTIAVGAGLTAYVVMDARGGAAQARQAPSAAASSERGSAVAPDDRRVFFGDLHLHTTNSADAWAWGTKVTPAMAFAFAKGEAVKVPAIQVNSEEGLNVSGDVVVRRKWPLDFLAVTDHADASALGVEAQFDHPDSPKGMTPEAVAYRANPAARHSLNLEAIKRLWPLGTVQEPEPPAPGERVAPGRRTPPQDNTAWSLRVWEDNKRAANAANEPGKFTAFIAYEWTATRNGWMHRNVIFKGDDAPPPFGAQQSNRPEDLWTYLEGVRARGQEVLAIPHNPNYNNAGFFFDWNDSDGKPIDEAYAQRRALNEPLVEISQHKGQSETTPGLSPNDEFSNFEVMDSVRNSTIGGKYVRQAYGRGLVIQSKVGANPYKMGIVGASDIHNGLSVSYEDGYSGGHFGTPDGMRPGGNFVRNTLGLPPVGPNGAQERAPDADANILWSPGSLTGVWAEENTRDSIFAALKRKETFATSGTRLRLRMFGGWGYADRMLQNAQWVRDAYARGVAMGGDMPVRPSGAGAPKFIVQAAKDPEGANLDRIQIVKVWLENGRSMERVYDAAVSPGRTIDPRTGRSKAAVGNTVDLKTGRYANTIGAATLSAVWTDPDFKPEQAAVYYARVIEIPTPRWSTLLAIRNHLPLTSEVAPTIQERGWASPIWYTPAPGARTAGAASAKRQG